MSKINSIRSIFNYLKFQRVVEDYTTIDVNNGIRSRINGKGTSPKSKEVILRPDEESKLKAAIRANCNDILDYLDKIENNT